jgi:hypothetical protein
MLAIPEELANNAHDVTGGKEVTRQEALKLSLVLTLLSQQHTCGITGDQKEVMCVGRFEQANVPGVLLEQKVV